MNCSYCPQVVHVQEYRGNGERVMSLDTYKTCLSKVPLETEVVFAGMAEPWLNPHATDMVLHALSQGYAVSIYTTTSGMSLEDVERLKAHTYLQFVIHLPDADGRMKLKVTDEYLAVLGACIRDIPHHYSMIGTPHPQVLPLVTRKLNDDSNSLLSRGGLNKEYEKPRKTGKIKCSACGPKLDHNVLLPNGNVALCCMIYDLKHIVGNLLTGTYDSLFESEEYKKVLRGQAGDESVDIACRSCELAVPA
jgi:radical SAM protein with 4Fe4S-binding SPASM domain